MCRTTLNVTGDLAIATMVSRGESRRCRSRRGARGGVKRPPVSAPIAGPERPAWRGPGPACVGVPVHGTIAPLPAAPPPPRLLPASAPSTPPMTTPASNTPGRRDLANAIRFLAIDAVQAANSGHPGMPMGMADIAEVLWNDYLRHNPNNPKWFNRDRFLLSNGHGSMLQYALLHLAGYDLPIDELKNFRQLDSKTPGHPENFMTPGVETTTGPLGQGFANAVGMALAEKLLAQRFNKPEFEIVDHHTYVFMGDGCLMEGISHEAASLAGTWGLQQAGRVLGRQQDLHRRQHRWLVHRQHPGALRGLRLERRARRRRPRRGRDQDRDRNRAQVQRQADADLLPHHDRLRFARPRPARNPATARRWARTKSSPRAKRWTGRTRRSRSRRRSTTAGARDSTGSRARSGVEHAVRQVRRAVPGAGRRTDPPLAQRAAGRLHRSRRCLHRQAAGRRPGRRLAQGLADGDRSLRAAAAGADRRFRRPGAFQPDLVEGQQVGRHRRSQRQLHLLTACANSR